MNIKKTVKKIAALGASAGMLGLTAGAALAQPFPPGNDLADYPNFVMSDGAFDGRIVLGATAEIEDMLGATDIASSLQAASTTPVAIDGSTQTDITGDAVRVEAPGDILEVGELLSDVTSLLTDQDLEMLRSGTVSTRRTTTQFQQTIEFDYDGASPDHGRVVHKERQTRAGRERGIFLEFRQNQPLFSYELDFTTGLRSSTRDLGGDRFQAVDLEDETIFMLGNYYTVTRAVWDDNSEHLELEMLAGDYSAILGVGQTRTIRVDGRDYEVTIQLVTQPSGIDNLPSARIMVNGEVTRTLRAGQTDTVDGIEIGIRDISLAPPTFREADPVSLVDFWLGANKVIFNGQTGRVEVDNENVRAATVSLDASFANNEVRLNRIQYDVDVDPDFRSEIHLAPGEGIRQFLRDEEAFLGTDFDIRFEGLTEPQRTEIAFNPRGDDEYELEFTNRRGERFNVPFIFFADDNEIGYGEDVNTRLVFHETLVVDGGEVDWDASANIRPDDFFVLTDGAVSDSARDSFVLQWTDIDELNRNLRFAHASDSGNPVQATFGAGTLYDLSTVTAAGSAMPPRSGTMQVGGRNYDFWVFTDGAAEPDYRLIVDLDRTGGVAGTGANAPAADGEYVTAASITVRGGGVLYLDVNAAADAAAATPDFEGNLNIDGWYGDSPVWVALRTLEKDIDSSDGDVLVTWEFGTDNANDELDLVTPPTAVDALGGFDFPFYEASDRGSDMRFALDRYGAIYEWDRVSGGADPLVISYPHQQVEAQVFVVGGAVQRTTTTTGTGADRVNVLPVGLTVLDRDITDPARTNHIVVGGPCVNTIAATLLGNPVDCAEGFEPNMGMIRTFAVGDRVAVLVAGLNAQDTVQTSRVLARAATETVSGMSGDSVEVVVSGGQATSVRSAQ